MGIARGPNTVKDGLVFGYDTGYGVADNSTATRFYPGEATTNFVTTNLETLGTDGSGQSSIGTRTTIAPNHVRIVDVASNTRQSHLISGLTASTIYTVSIQFKKITGTPTFRFQLQGYSGSSYVNTIKFTSTAETGLEDIEGWQTAEWTFTLPSNCNALRIWWQDGADYATYTHSFELKNPQLEAKSHVTPYVSGTRSSTASLIDLKKTTDIDASSMSFDSTGQPTFDGTDDTLLLGSSSAFNITSKMSVFAWIKPDSISGWKGIFGGAISGFVHFQLYNGGINAYVYGPAASYGNPDSASIGTNVWTNVGFTFGNNTLKVYLNGEQLPTTVTGNGGNISSNSDVRVGWAYATSRLFDGHINALTVHNKALTDTEVKQNYNAYKNRFDI